MSESSHSGQASASNTRGSDQSDRRQLQCLEEREEACRLLVGLLDAFDARWTGERPPPRAYYNAQRFIDRMLPARVSGR